MFRDTFCLTLIHWISILQLKLCTKVQNLEHEKIRHSCKQLRTKFTHPATCTSESLYSHDPCTTLQPALVSLTAAMIPAPPCNLH